MVIVHSVALSLEEATEEQENYDIIIQTTTIGASTCRTYAVTNFFVEKGTIVSDIIYNPFETKILCEAKEQVQSFKWY